METNYIHIYKDNYQDYTGLDVVAFSYAFSGAMGEGGGVTIATSDGKWYHTNYAQQDFPYDLLFEIIPVLMDCCFDLFGFGSIVPDGWTYEDLGCGNHLVVRSDIYMAFSRKARAARRKHYSEDGHGVASPSFLYPKWKEFIREILEETASAESHDANNSDKFNLERFLNAQKHEYDFALQEIRYGRKYGHWIWYIFPQMRSLAHSSTANFYGITCLDEAKEYLAHPVLGARLREITEAFLAIEGKTAEEILSSRIDALKLCSCMTLFDTVSQGDIFEKVLEKYYEGKKDPQTIFILDDLHKIGDGYHL